MNDPIIPIDEEHKKKTIELATHFMPVHQPTVHQLIKELLFHVCTVRAMRNMALFMSCFLGIFGMLQLVLPTTILMMLIPIMPITLVGGYTLWRYNQTMMELEATFKYTIQQIFCAKVIMLTMLSIALLIVVASVSYETTRITALSLLLAGSTAILLWTYLLLRCFIDTRYKALWPVFSMCWIIFVFLDLDVAIWIYCACTIVLLISSALALKKLWQKEGGVIENLL